MPAILIAVLSIVWVLSVSFPSVLPAAQSKGISVLIKDQAGRKVGLYKGSRALVIGVSNYTAGWPDLESVPGEIDQIEDSLKKQGFKVVKILNPTSDQLSTAFKKFINQYGYEQDNRLLFFFSGHGHTRKEGKKGYLVPADAPDPRYDDKGFIRKALGMAQILTWARRIEAKHALFVFDSCFSGTIFKTKALPKYPPHISDLTSRPVRQFISAGSAGEEVPARSVFVPSFVRALRGEADLDGDKYVTGTELGMYLHKKVLSYEAGQTPQYGKIRDPELDEGDFVFCASSGVTIEKPGRSTLSVKCNVPGARVRILNINPKFSQGIELEPGQYHVEVSAKDYKTQRKWVKLGAGEEKKLRINLEKIIRTWREPVTGMEFVWVPAGCYEMGCTSECSDDEKNYAHEVCIDGFWIGKYEVTNAQYRKFKKDHSSNAYKGYSLNGHNQPVIIDRWFEANEFAKWLNQKNRGQYEFRLPTEAEWEYACRAGTKSAYFWGNNPDESCEYANAYDRTAAKYFDQDSNFMCDDGYPVTSPVGSFKPNNFGIYDMIGNVCEFCEDRWHENAYSKHNRNNPLNYEGANHVIRGGAYIFWSNPKIFRSDSRIFDLVGYTGIRIVRSQNHVKNSLLSEDIEPRLCIALNCLNKSEEYLRKQLGEPDKVLELSNDVQEQLCYDDAHLTVSIFSIKDLLKEMKKAGKEVNIVKFEEVERIRTGVSGKFWTLIKDYPFPFRGLNIFNFNDDIEMAKKLWGNPNKKEKGTNLNKWYYYNLFENDDGVPINVTIIYTPNDKRIFGFEFNDYGPDIEKDD